MNTRINELKKFLIDNDKFIISNRVHTDIRLNRLLIKSDWNDFVSEYLGYNEITSYSLYNKLFNESNICNYCGHIKTFRGFKTGYLKCDGCKEYDKKDIKSKQDIYEFIIKYKMWTNVGIIKSIRKSCISDLIPTHIDNSEELYDYLNESDTICKCDGCNNKRKYKNFCEGYNDFCSIECNNKWLSYSRMGDNNPCHKMTEITKIKSIKKQSESIKKKILSGEFTPNITNSWCKSKHKIFIKEKCVSVRSSWEAYFYVLNDNLLYEKLRIPYYDEGKLKTYIVDFIDDKNNIVYEVKPESMRNTKRNINKQKSLESWCETNNYKCITITEEYFKDKVIDMNLLKSSPTYDTLLRLSKKYFKPENIINYEN